MRAQLQERGNERGTEEGNERGIEGEEGMNKDETHMANYDITRVNNPSKHEAHPK